MGVTLAQLTPHYTILYPQNCSNNSWADASLPQKAGGSVSPMGRAYNAEIDLRFSGKVKYVLGKFE